MRILSGNWAPAYMGKMDRITRGKTRPGRLRRLDQWVDLAKPVGLGREDVVVDVGVGANPDTTLEWFEILARQQISLVGTDIDAERVQTAQNASRPGLSFKVAGFDIRDTTDRPPRLIRVMNVLRQYRVEQVADAHRQLGLGLGEGGLIIEGTTDKSGDALVAHLLRRRGPGLLREGLLFSGTFVRGFAPMLFRDRLPRDLRDQVRDGGALFPFFSAWQEHFLAIRRGESAQADFEACARSLASDGVALDLSWIRHGHLVWRPETGVPCRPG